jgi:hypothetical protein
MPTLAIFQLYRGVNKCYINLNTYKILKYEKILVYKINGKKNKTKCILERNDMNVNEHNRLYMRFYT